ncbi:hypothetical protein C1646_760659 [Rhizophagus diaphanus]|nr:hypothetical protein C1646_760659 [Rhizophagus diaphanus] [Rhizophagus sp. MUCL 43196]
MSIQFFSKLSQDYVEILEDDEYYDITIEVGEEPDNDSNNLTHIKLPNISPEIFQIILKYLYGGIFSLHEYDTIDVFKVLITAEELLLQELVDYLQNYFIENQTEWMEKHFIELTNQISFKSNNLLELQKFYSDIWTDNDFKMIKDTLKICLPLIRFYSLSSEEFLKKLLNQKLINLNIISIISRWIDRVDFNSIQVGFTPKKFHKLCDNKSNIIITFIKVRGTGEILGGYNPSIWKTSGGWGQSLYSFIFSFKSKDNFKDPFLSRLSDSTIPFNENICKQVDYEKSIRDTEDNFYVEDYEVFQIKRK